MGRLQGGDREGTGEEGRTGMCALAGRGLMGVVTAKWRSPCLALCACRQVPVCAYRTVPYTFQLPELQRPWQPAHQLTPAAPACAFRVGCPPRPSAHLGSSSRHTPSTSRAEYSTWPAAASAAAPTVAAWFSLPATADTPSAPAPGPPAAASAAASCPARAVDPMVPVPAGGCCCRSCSGSGKGRRCAWMASSSSGAEERRPTRCQGPGCICRKRRWSCRGVRAVEGKVRTAEARCVHCEHDGEACLCVQEQQRGLSCMDGSMWVERCARCARLEPG